MQAPVPNAHVAVVPATRRWVVGGLLVAMSSLYWLAVFASAATERARFEAVGAEPVMVAMHEAELVWMSTFGWVVAAAGLHVLLGLATWWRGDRGARDGIVGSAVLHVTFALAAGILRPFG